MALPAVKSSNRPGVSISAVLVYAVLLTSLLYALYFHLVADAPMRLQGHRPAALEAAENLQSRNAAAIDAASAQQNVQLHFQMPAEMWMANASFFTGAYYRSAYEMYPRRVYVGLDDRVINFAVDLQAADQLPSVNWLHQHQVPAVFSFVPGDAHGPADMVYRVP